MDVLTLCWRRDWNYFQKFSGYRYKWTCKIDVVWRATTLFNLQRNIVARITGPLVFILNYAWKLSYEKGWGRDIENRAHSTDFRCSNIYYQYVIDKTWAADIYLIYKPWTEGERLYIR